MGILLFSQIVDAKEIKTSTATLTVSDEISEKYPELIKLITRTESMDDDERQYWFDILPTMMDSQVDRLFDILETERKKLLELEIKYQNEIKTLSRKKSRENLDNTIPYNLKNHAKDTANKLQILYAKENKIPFFGIKNYSSLTDGDIIITMEEYDHFLEKNAITEIEERIFLRYVEIILSDKKLYDDILPKQLIEAYLDRAYTIAKKNNDNYYLLKISLVSQKHQEIKLSTAGKYSEIAKRRYEKSLLNPKKIMNFVSLLNRMLDLTYLRANQECDEYCGELLTKFDALFDGSLSENRTAIQKSIENEPHLLWYYPMLIDVIDIFNSDLKLNSILGMKESLMEQVEKANSNLNNDTQWYALLHNNYFSGKGDKTYKAVAEELKDKIETSDFIGAIALDGKLLEAGVFSAINSIKAGNSITARQTLTSLSRIGTTRSSPAYEYIEHDLRDYLIKSLNQKQTVIKGPRKLAISYLDGEKKVVVEHRHKHAIIVGISDYNNLPTTIGDDELKKYSDLKYADNDALAFKKFLMNADVSGGNWNISTFVNENATLSNVRGKISEVLSRAGKNDLVYIFFSGHGRSVDHNGDETFLMTVNASQKTPYVGVDLNWLSRAIQRSKARHIVAFIDACRSGSKTNAKGVNNIRANYINRIQALQDRTKIIFSSASGDQVSYESDKFQHGYFTKFLLDALIHGKAPELNDDGMVGLYEAERYVSEAVRKATDNLQQPQVPNISDFGKSVFFPLALR